jgi:phosphoribosylaminoimidazolecarboxamide formyltransferase/IMP cyclohydrolase
MKANDGVVSYDTRFTLATKVYSHTAQYDGAIANYLTSLDASRSHAAAAPIRKLNVAFEKVQDMRYGENPHQSAAFYRDVTAGRRAGQLPPAAGQGTVVQQHR